MNEEELFKRLREAFRSEAEERLANLSSSLLELEKTSETDKQAHLEIAFREAHSLKGAARAVNLMEIESLCQSVEEVFADLKRGEVQLSTEIFDLLHHSVKGIENFLAEESSRNKKGIQELVCKLEDLNPDEEQDDREKYISKPEIRKKNDAETPDQVSAGVPHIQTKPLMSDTIRISVSKLDTLLRESEELASLKLITNQHLLNLRKVVGSYEHWEKKWAKAEPKYRLLCKQISSQSETFEENGPREPAQYAGCADSRQTLFPESSLNGLTRFLEWNQKHIRSLGREIGKLTKAAEQDERVLSRMVDELLGDMKKVMMLPFSSLLGIFPRMVRDLARDQGKEADLVLQGDHIEIDRRILEEMKDPLIHLLRNAIDHGLEDAETRMKRQKPRTGTINLAISQTESSKVEILLSDDGGGIRIGTIKKKAAESGILSEKDAKHLDVQEALSLIFRSGISSSNMITEISGRGLGLAIVQEKVEKLGGLLHTETAVGEGTAFRIQLPVTLTTFRGVLVKAANSLFIVPAYHVEHVLKVRQNKIRTIENKATISFDGEVIPLADLAHTLKLQPQSPEPGTRDSDFLPVMILGNRQKRVAFKVAKIICEQEVLAKSLGKQLSRVPNIAGATILGTGKVVPILNVHDLMKLSAGNTRLSWMTEAKSPWNKEGGVKKQSVLIAEDSITSRMLIKNILEAAGYSVKIAVDGRAAYTLLKTEPFDVVISDVEMPRMNGFELTANIRGNEKLSDIPVILITSLDSREDRERGIDVGANAYIVKSSFDHSNLLEVISRLI